VKQTEMPSSRRIGMTFVEIIIAGGLAVLVIGATLYAFMQFRRGFEKGESSAVVLQEGALFLGFLRNDLINAVIDKTLPPDRWRDAVMTVTSNQVSFTAFHDDEGNTEKISYAFSPALGGGSLTRTQGSSRTKTLIDKGIASLSWSLGEEIVPGIGSGVRRIWLNVDLTIGGQGKAGMTSKIITLSTKLFPTRMNRQLNGKS